MPLPLRDCCGFLVLSAALTISPTFLHARQTSRFSSLAPQQTLDANRRETEGENKAATQTARDATRSTSANTSPNASGWRSALESEEPSAIFFERDTLQTQTAMLWSLRVWNDRPFARTITLRWRVRDADGLVLWRRDSRLTVPARGFIHRRELFEPQRLGAFRLVVEANDGTRATRNTNENNIPTRGDARGNTPSRDANSRDAARREQPEAASRSVADTGLRQTLAFAVVAAPSPSGGLRPRSFFALSARTLLSTDELDFYARIGARVLRSPWLAPQAIGAMETDAASAPRDFRLLDRQMQARLERGLATRGVLSFEATERALSPLLVRYNNIAAWEWAGRNLSQSETLRVARTLRPDSTLLAPLTPAATPANTWDGVVASWPNDAGKNAWAQDKEDTPSFAATSFAATLRALLGTQSRAARRNSSLYLLQEGDAADANRDADFNSASSSASAVASASASDMVMRYVVAILAGASGMSASLSTPLSPAFDAPSLESSNALRERENDIRIARAAAFSTMTHLLEDTSLDQNVFARSPLLWGVSFQGAPVSDMAHVAVVWLDAAHEYSYRGTSARLTLPLPASSGARALDIYGNEIARARGNQLQVALGVAPIYIVSANRGARQVDSASWKRAWQEAAIEGMTPLAIQTLALTQTPQAQTPQAQTPQAQTPQAQTPQAQTPQMQASQMQTSRDRAAQSAPVSPRAAASSIAPSSVQRAPQTLRVRLQNVSNRRMAGSLRLRPPSGWMLKRDVQDFGLEAGESRVYGFAVTRSVRSANNRYPVRVWARSGRRQWSWEQTAVVATATSVSRAPQIDGNLNDWPDAAWMEARQNDGESESSSRMSTHAGGEHATGEGAARVALRWDANRLYIAARVYEPHLISRRAEDSRYDFYLGHDALQIAFGLRDDASVRPQRGPFRDTDYGFLLSPFDDVSIGASATGASANGASSQSRVVSGRVLRLWSPSIAPENGHDAVRWGGVAPASQCVVRRDGARGVTVYEASLPLDAMPALRAPVRAARDLPVRFTWILHRDEGRALQWSREVGVFPWWSNADPISGQTRFAAQTPLGFSLGEAIAKVPQGSASKTPAPRPTTKVRHKTTSKSVTSKNISRHVLPPQNSSDEGKLAPTAPSESPSSSVSVRDESSDDTSSLPPWPVR